VTSTNRLFCVTISPIEYNAKADTWDPEGTALSSLSHEPLTFLFVYILRFYLYTSLVTFIVYASLSLLSQLPVIPYSLCLFDLEILGTFFWLLFILLSMSFPLLSCFKLVREVSMMDNFMCQLTVQGNT
jgi:hypothetical protein